MVTVFEHVTSKQLDRYVDQARSMGKITDVRRALQELIDPVNEQLGHPVFTTREDGRYFICEFDEVRIFTVYEHPTTGKLAVSYHPECGESIFTTFYDILSSTIYAKVLEWYITALKDNPVMTALRSM